MNKEIPNFSEEIVKDLKLKYPKGLKIIEIFAEEKDKKPIKFLVKKPSKNLFYLLMSKEYKNDEQKTSEAFISNCVLAGDLEAVENDAAIYAELIRNIGEFMRSARSVIKNV